jgi:hypothetical protein
MTNGCLRILGAMLLILLGVSVQLACAQTYACTTKAISPKARAFTLTQPTSATPSSSLTDAPLMDPPAVRGRFDFSNQCDNWYRVTIRQITATVLTGTLAYFDPWWSEARPPRSDDDEIQPQTVALTCRRVR